MTTLNTTYNTIPNGPALYVHLDDVLVDDVLVYGSFYLDVHIDPETGVISVLGGDADDDIYLGGEEVHLPYEQGGLFYHAEHAIVAWLASDDERAAAVIDCAFEGACLSHEEQRLTR